MTVYYLCPDRQVPTGGVMQLYRHVDILNSAGISAAIVHARRGLRAGWFTNETRILYPPLTLTGRDLLAVPEVYGMRLATIAPRIRRVSVNQNGYQTFRGIPDATEHPYNSCDSLEAVLAVSENTEVLLMHTFPHLDVRRFWVGIDPQLMFPGSSEKRRRLITYMPRRRASRAQQVLSILAARGCLEGWEVLPLDGLSHATVAGVLREAAIFMSFSEQEGCPLPPLEAMACGAIVIGFSGLGGDEYFREDIAFKIPEEDVLAFAQAMEAVMNTWTKRRDEWGALAERASQHVLRTYSPERERTSVLKAYEGLLREDGKGEERLAVVDASIDGYAPPGAVRQLLSNGLLLGSKILARGSSTVLRD